jgi:protein-L-isoaspartate(D-aspartate) O-methyltransferase
LEERGLIRSAQVRAAFRAVERETFLSEFAARAGLEAVYRDEAIPTKFGASGFAVSSSSQPAIMAQMLERLALQPGFRVLEIGTGTGYNAALLAEIVGPSGAVTTIDIDAEVAHGARAALGRSGHRVSVHVGDGREGVLDRSPYDRIIVTASSNAIARAWFDQLREGGLLEVPLRITERDAQAIPTLRKVRGGLESVSLVFGSFMPLRSADGSRALD